MRASVLLVACVLAAGAADPKPDDGFTLLLNGKDLTGWKVQKGGASLDGKTEAAKGRFVVQDGVLVIDPKVKGDVVIETAKTFGGDATIRFEFKPGDGCNNDLFFRGIKFDLKPKDVPPMKDGEWNTFEIAVTGNSAAFRCNDQPVATKAAKPAATPFGIRAEFGAIEFRNVRIKAGASQ